MKKIAILLILTVITLTSYSQSIPKVAIPLSNDSLTGLQKERAITNVLIGFSLNSNGEIDSTSQTINIYYKDFVKGANGEAINSLTKSGVFILKQGTNSFADWFSVFNENFINKLTDDLNLYKDSL